MNFYNKKSRQVVAHRDGNGKLYKAETYVNTHFYFTSSPIAGQLKEWVQKQGIHEGG